ncbi:hypothetical protein RR46_01384 [Papilio xuthus]|uniref:Uncharacterized protein n=1 Tax=Papilio xuthus TaxID=66420 RepID=A0A0N1ICW9_PAPXU|nr:hypothetical protein RR46_01384 [Papilio xuthus]
MRQECCGTECGARTEPSRSHTEPLGTVTFYNGGVDHASLCQDKLIPGYEYNLRRRRISYGGLGRVESVYTFRGASMFKNAEPW